MSQGNVSGVTLTGWILATVAAAGLYGAVKDKPWSTVLGESLSKSYKGKPNIVNPATFAQPAAYDITGTDTGTGANPNAGSPPASIAGLPSQVQQVVGFAYAQLGKPYRWAASGPNEYDCSGLTMACFKAAGINLPHNAALQYAATRKDRLPKTTSPPAGALVFFFGLDHVGLSIGGGQMIAAPHTGTVVQIQSIANEGGLYGVTYPFTTAGA